MKAIELRYTLESSVVHGRPSFDGFPASVLQRVVDFIDPIDRSALRSTCSTVSDALDSSDALWMDQMSLHQAKLEFERHSLQGFQNLRHVSVNVASWHAHDTQDLTRRILAAPWKELRTLHIISQESFRYWFGEFGHTLFSSWGLNGFISITGVSHHAPKLRSLTLDCDVGHQINYTVDTSGYEIPEALFTEGCGLRRLIVRGLPWPERLVHQFQELRSFTFATKSVIDSHMIEKLLECTPNLCSLRLQCSAFQDLSPVEPPMGSIKPDLTRLKHVVLRNDNIADDHSFNSYFTQRGAPDVVAIVFFYSCLGAHRGFPPQRCIILQRRIKRYFHSLPLVR